MQELHSIMKQILKLENDLLTSEVRKSPEKIKKLIADDFIEYTSSGSEYHYKNGDTFQKPNDNQTVYGEIIDFEVKKLAEDSLLALYKFKKNSEKDENKIYSLRSSIWKCINGEWKMIFHQGTMISVINKKGIEKSREEV